MQDLNFSSLFIIFCIISSICVKLLPHSLEHRYDHVHSYCHYCFDYNYYQVVVSIPNIVTLTVVVSLVPTLVFLNLGTNYPSSNLGNWLRNSPLPISDHSHSLNLPHSITTQLVVVGLYSNNSKHLPFQHHYSHVCEPILILSSSLLILPVSHHQPGWVHSLESEVIFTCTFLSSAPFFVALGYLPRFSRV